MFIAIGAFVFANLVVAVVVTNLVSRGSSIRAGLGKGFQTYFPCSVSLEKQNNDQLTDYYRTLLSSDMSRISFS